MFRVRSIAALGRQRSWYPYPCTKIVQGPSGKAVSLAPTPKVLRGFGATQFDAGAQAAIPTILEIDPDQLPVRRWRMRGQRGRRFSDTIARNQDQEMRKRQSPTPK